MRRIFGDGFIHWVRSSANFMRITYDFQWRFGSKFWRKYYKSVNKFAKSLTQRIVSNCSKLLICRKIFKRKFFLINFDWFLWHQNDSARTIDSINYYNFQDLIHSIIEFNSMFKNHSSHLLIFSPQCQIQMIRTKSNEIPNKSEPKIYFHRNGNKESCD